MVIAALIAGIALFAVLFGASTAGAALNVTDFKMTPTTPASTSSAYQAGGHPTVNFRINPDAVKLDKDGDDIKKVTYEFPAGALGDPSSISSKCTNSQFNSDKCPAASYIGSIASTLRINTFFGLLYSNLSVPGSMYVLESPTAGSAITVGFILRPPGYRILFLKSEVTGVVSVRSGLDADYGLTIEVDNIPRVLQTTLGINVPSTIQDLTLVLNNKSNTKKNGPYFTYAGTRCDVSNVRAQFDSYKGDHLVKTDAFSLTGCNNVPFTPGATVVPDTVKGNQPAKWTADFSVPTSVAAIQQSHIKKISVDLPPSTQLNYDELATLTTICTEAQINADNCPAASRIGSVHAQVPLLDGASPNFVGDVFLLSKTNGVTFGYIVRGPNSITAQVRGQITPIDSDNDGIPDFLRASSDNMPQAPFSPAQIKFEKALALNPINCGPQQVVTTITGWSGASWTGSNTINVTDCGPSTPNTTITSQPTNPTNDNQPTIGFSADPAADATFEVSVDGGPYTSVGTATTFQPSAPLTDGTHTISVRACNAGATPECDTSPASVTFKVDTVAPSLTITQPAANALLNTSLVTTKFQSSDTTATFTCQLDGGAAASCSSPKNYSGVSQGAHTITVVAKDAAGNQTSESVSFTVDTVAPTAVATCSANTPAASDATCIFSFDEPVTDVTCTMTGQANDASCVSPKVYNGLPNGIYTFKVSGTDAAGNVGTFSTNVTIDVDTTPPETTINSGPSGLINSDTATFTFSANEPATFLCSMDGAPATACASGVEYTGLAEGPHTFSVAAVDTSGNIDPTPATRSFTVDTIAPAAPSLTRTAPATTPTQSRNATLTASGVEAGAQLQYSVGGGAWTNSNNPVQLSSLSDGSYSVTVRAVDAAGNASAASNAVTWTVDNVAPAAPSVVRTSPTSSPTNSTDATITISGVEAGGTVECSTDGGSTWSSAAPCQAGTVSLSGLTDGTKKFSARVRDAAGNVSAATAAADWVVDTIAPVAPTVTRTNPTADPTNSDSQVISITGVEAGATLSCVLDGTAHTPCSGTVTLTGLSGGSHSFGAVVTDAAGNVSPPAAVNWTIDLSAVATPVISAGPADGSLTQSKTASFEFASSTPSVDYECRIDGGAWGACTSPHATGTLGDGSHTFFVRAKNGVGTLSGVAQRQWTIDTIAPTAPALARTAPASSPTNSTDAVLTASGVETGAQLQYSTDGGSSWTNSANPVELSGLADGNHSVTVRAVDAAGNESAASNAVTWTVDTVAPGEPAVVRTNPTADPTNSSTQQISVTPAEPGGSLSCELDGAAHTPCAAGTVSLTGLASGSHTFSVQQTDAAGNTGDAASVTWIVDVSDVMAPAITSGPAEGSYSQSSTATFEFASSTPGVSYECQIDGGAWSACTSPHATGSLGEGAHTFAVRAENNVGTQSAATTRQWTIDTIAPDAPSLARTAPASSPTNSTDAVLTASGVETGAQLQYSTDGGSSWTNSANPVELSGLAGGNHSVTVRAVDAAGNESAASNAVTWTVDTVAPGEPTVVRTNPTADPTASTSQEISIATSETGGTLTCELDGTAHTPCAAGTVNLSGLSSATHTFSVFQTDDAGNVGDAAAVTWTVNAGGVNAPVISSGPAEGSWTSDAGASFEFASSTPGVSYECQLDGGAWNACTSPSTTGALADGSHTFAVRAENNVGTQSPATQRSWNIDTADPAAPTISLDAPTTSPTQSTSASISFAGESNATFWGSLDGEAFAEVTNPVTLSGLADGAHTYTLYQQDRAGNTSDPVSVGWTVDTTAPDAPVLERTAPATSPTTSTSATLTATGVESGAQLQYKINGVGTWTDTVNPIELSGLADGTHTYSVRAVDAAGNASAASNSVSWTVDTTPPPAPSVTGPSGTTALQSATISFSSTESGATFECSLDGGAFAACDSPVNLTGLQNGSHTFAVKALDALGNASAATSISWTVDTSAFTVALTAGPSGIVASSDAAFTYEATITAGTTYECSLDGAAFSACAAAGQDYTSLADGEHTFKVVAKNGGQTTPEASRTWTVDTTGPTINVTGDATTGASGTITFTAIDDTTPVTVECSLDGAAAQSCSGSYAFSGLASGQHTLMVTATDGVGNSASEPFTWTVDATPPTTSISGTPSSPTQSTSATLTLNSTESPATFRCSINGGSFSACTSPLELTGLADGTHSVIVRASDQYGNEDPVGATATWKVDTTAPAAPSLTRTAPATSPTQSKSATLTASGVEAGAQLQYSVNGGTWTDSSNPVELSGLTDGSYSVTVRAVDAAGNESAASNAATWTVDTTAPAAPSLTRTAPATSPTQSKSATLTASGVEAGAQLQYSVNGGAWTNSSNPVQLSGLTDGSYSVTVRAVDAAGNESAASNAATWTVDTTAPAAPSLTRTAPATSPTQSKSATLTASGVEAGAQLQYRIGTGAWTDSDNPVELTNLSDGSYSVTVRAVDAAGNESAASNAATWTVDTTAPAAPALARTAPATSPTQSKSATLTASGVEAGAQLQYRIGTGAWTDSDNPVELTNLSDGSYSVTVRAVDAAGNESAASNAATWTVDTTAPAAPSLTRTAPATSPTQSKSATLTASGVEAGAQLQYSVNGGTWTNSANPVELTNLNDGAYSVTVRAVDAAGNESAASNAATWTVDTTAPAAPSLARTAPASSPTNSTDAVLTASGVETGAQLQYSTDGGSSWTNSANPVELSGLADGNHSVTVRAVDAAGNESAASNAVTWTVDTIAPGQPTVVRTSPTTSPTNSSTQVLSITPAEAGGTLNCTLNGVAVSCTTGTNTLTGLADDSYTFSVSQTDAAGNTGSSDSVGWTVDTTAPAAPSLTRTAPATSPTQSKSATLTASGVEAGAQLQYSVNGGTWTNSANPVELSGLTDGSYSVTVRAVDAAGNESAASNAATWTVDTTAPAAPALARTAPATSPTQSKSATLTASGVEAGAQLQYRIGTGAWTDSDNPVELTNLSDGSYSVTVRAVDAAGNESAASNAVSWTVDTTAPDAPVVTRTAPTSTPTNSTSATITITGVESGATLECSTDGGNSWNDCSSPINLSGLADGTYSYVARATDAAGNVSADSNAVSWTVDTAAPDAPVVTRTAPTSTPTNSTSATITITGVESGATLECSTDGGNSWNGCSSPINLSGLADGTYSYVARATDAAGNVSADSNVVSWTVDTVPPAAPSVSQPADSGDTSIQISFFSSGASSYTCSLDGAAPQPCVSPATVNVPFETASHTFSVTAKDAAGNESGATTVTWQTIAGTPPETILGDAPAAQPTLTPVIPVAGDDDGNPVSTFECRVNGAPSGWTSCDPNNGIWGSASFDDDATNVVEIAAVNGAGADPTPEVTHIWTSTQSPTADATVQASDTRAGAHPDVSGSIVLNGGYNPKSVELDMPLGLNGALTAINEWEECPDWGTPAEWMMCDLYFPTAKIGHISGVGVATPVGKITDAGGDIYLTSTNLNMDVPAGVWVAVTSPSHPELGTIYGKGEVKIEQAENGEINGKVWQRIEIDNIPEQTLKPVLADPQDPYSVYDYEPGVRFHINEVELNLEGDPDGGIYPLITNPTTCDTHTFEGDGATWSSDGFGGTGPLVPHVSVPYPVTDCASLEFTPTVEQTFFQPHPITGVNYNPLNPSSGMIEVGTDLDTNLAAWRMGVAGTIATVTNNPVPYDTSERRANMENMTVLQPQGTGAYFAALAGEGALCPGSVASNTGLFNRAGCDLFPGAKVGTVEIQTPLLNYPLEGEVWLIQNNPLPWLGIHISPTSGWSGTNPYGVEMNITATTNLACSSDVTQASCDADTTQKRVLINVDNMPDVPIDNIVMDLSGLTPRAPNNAGQALPTLILAMPDAGAAGCKPVDAIHTTMVSGTGSAVSQTQGTTMKHCDITIPQPTLTRTSPSSSTTTDTTATFNVANNAPGTTLYCRLDGAPYQPCPANPIQLTGVTEGAHTFYARSVSSDGEDASPQSTSNWTVEEDTGNAFDATLDFVSSNPSLATFAWSRTESGGSVLCKKDNGPFAACVPGIPANATSGNWNWTGIAGFPAGSVHTLTMRFTSPSDEVVERSASFTK